MAFTVSAAATNVQNSLELKVFVVTGATETGGASAGTVVDFAAPEVALTPNFSNSLVLFGIEAPTPGASITWTAAANNTIEAGDSGTTGGDYYTDGYYNGTVTSGTGITLGSTTPTAYYLEIAGYELPPSGTPAIDGSTPAIAAATSSPVATASFTPPAGSVLVAVVMVSQDAATAVTISDTSGLGLTWTKRIEENYTTGFSGGVGIYTTTIPLPNPSVSPATLETPLGIGQTYTLNLSASGGSGSGYTWSVSSGSLPSGLSLTGSGATATISGTVTGSPASSTFTIQVTDSASSSGTQQYTIQTITVPAATVPALPAIPGFSTPGAATPGDPGPAPSGPATGPAFYPATQPARARVAARARLAGVYMGLDPQAAPDTSFGTGQVQWNAGGPVHNPARGPVFYPKTHARARIVPRPRLAGVYMGVSPRDTSFGTGQIQWNAGAQYTAPAVGPVFHQATSPCRARIPREATAGSITGYGSGGAICGAVNGNGFGNGNGSKGAPVNNPAPGPVFFQRRTPVRFILPPPHPRAGRVGSSFGAPVQNPIHGPPAYPLQGPVRARIPQLQPRAGRVASSPGGPLRNPTAGPVFTQRTSPAQARRPLPPRGRVYSSALRKLTPPSSGPVFVQANQALRARRPLQPFLRGRMASVWGAPVQNPTPGPSFTQATSPARIRASLPARGRVYSNPGQRLLVHIGPAFRPADQALRAKLPQQPLLRGRVTSNPGAPVRNPAPGPVFIQADSPARTRVPQTFSKGRVSSSPGAPVRNPTPGPAFRQATAPARIRPALPPRGRIAFNAGAPVTVTAPGPGFSPRNLVKAQLPLPRRGTCRAIRFYPVPSNPTPGPVFSPRVTPVRAQVPPFSKGRISSNKGAPVTKPAVGPVFFPKTSPVQARQPLPRRGQCRFLRRILLGQNPTPGPVFTQATAPVQAKVPLPRRGRISSNPGVIPVSVTTGPVFVQKTSPVRIRPELPPRGRTSSNAGAPLHNPTPGPVFRQATSPARARRPLPPHGRTSSNPGAPVRNPTQGPVFRQATAPIRARVPQRPLGGHCISTPPSTVPVDIFGLFEIVFPCAHLDAPASFPLPPPAVTLTGTIFPGEIGPFTPRLPNPKTGLSGTVLHQPFHITLPPPATSLTAQFNDARFSITLPLPVTGLAGKRAVDGTFRIIFNICSGMGGRYGLVITPPKKPLKADFPESVDYATGIPYVTWTASDPYTSWITG